MSEIPDNLSPFFTHHPASSAYRMSLSPHEWTWTQSEQEAIATALVLRDAQTQQLRARIAELEKAVRHANDLCYNSPNNAAAVDNIEEFLAPIVAAMERKES